MRIVDCGLWTVERRRKSKIQNPKSLAVLAFSLAGASLASAQFDSSLISAVRIMRDNNALTGAFPKDPLQPSGFPHPDAKRPDEESNAQTFRFINADTTQQNGDHVRLVGAVEFEVRGYHVRADEVEGDTRTQIFTAKGHVLITGNGSNVYGDKITVDFASENYLAERAETQLSPDQLQNQLTDKLYVSGKLSSGTRLLTHTQDGLITTCNLDHPHYEILARDLDVRANKRIVLRDAKIRILDRTILQIPYLSIPIDNRTTRYTPYVGRTEDEGYFIKLAFAVPVSAKGDQTLLTHEEYMEKKGLGLGADYAYAFPTLSGVARVYKIFGPGDALNFSNQHRQAFRWGTASLDNDYQQNNYLTASNQTLLTTRASVTYNDFLTPRAKDVFTLNRTSNDAPSYSSVSETYGFVDARNVGRLRTDSQVNVLSTKNTTSSGTGTEAQRMQVKFLGSQDVGFATASLQYVRSIPISETKSYLGSSDLTPVFSLQSDSRRLLGSDLGREIPLRTELSFGQYADPRRQSQIERTAFSLAYNKSTPQTQRLTFDTAANFRQGLYSDDTAQYTLGLNENVRYKLGSDTGINLRYGYLRPYGYSPLSIDSAGKTNIVTTDVNARPVRPVLLGLQTGYDINREKEGQIAWQQVGIRSEWTPRPGIIARGLYTYDTYQQAFSQLRFDLTAYGRETRLNLNAQYDGIRHTWSTANGTVDGLRFGRVKIAALFSYNGYLKKFETRQYAFTYDLHCAEAVLAIQENETGFRPGRQIYLLFRLKALPFDLPFGTGTRGQPVGIGSGTSF